MPAVFSKLTSSQQRPKASSFFPVFDSEKKHCSHSDCSDGEHDHEEEEDASEEMLSNIGVPSKCLHCRQSCDICMLDCTCERCVFRRRLCPKATAAAQIAVMKSHKKLVMLEPKKRKKVIYNELKSCITKVTKKGSYKKAFFVGEGADRLSCCKKAFDQTYGINHTYVDVLVKYMKKKV